MADIIISFSCRPCKFTAKMSTEMVGLLVLSAFHLSTACSIFMFFKWARETYTSSEPTNIAGAMDVFFTLLLYALVMYVIEVLPPKGSITRFLSRVNTFNFLVVPFLFGLVAAIAHQNLMVGPGRMYGQLYVAFIVSEASFLALHATKEVSLWVSNVLFIQLGLYALLDLLTGDLSIILASCIAPWVAYIVYMSSKMVVGVIVFLTFHLSSACSLFMFFKRARKPKDVHAMDVVFILLLNVPLMYVMDVLPARQKLDYHLEIIMSRRFFCSVA